MAKKSYIIVGGGGHTSALIGVLLRQRAPLGGVVTGDPALLSTEIHGVPVIGLENEFAFNPDKHVIVNGVGNRTKKGDAGLRVRADVFTRYRDNGFQIAQVISGQAIIQPVVTQGEGVQIMPGTVVQAGAMLGENCILNTGALIDHDCVIGPHAHVAPGAVLCGAVTVGELAHVGAGAVILQGLKVGAGALIGAGVTVRHDIKDGETLV